jgi:hypothetical protein
MKLLQRQQQRDSTASSQTASTVMTYNTLDDASLASSSFHGIDHDEDLNEGESSSSVVDSKRNQFSNRAQKDISMDLNDLLQEMEEEREESHGSADPNDDSSVSSKSMHLNLFLNDGIEDSPKIGSRLQLDELPSSRGSLNWGSFMGSFSRKMKGSSRRLLSSVKNKKQKSDETEKEQQPEPRRKKVVRFKKFETVFSNSSSFSYLHRRETPRRGTL